MHASGRGLFLLRLTRKEHIEMVRAFLETTDPPFRGALNIWLMIAEKDAETADFFKDQFFCKLL